MSEFEYFAFMTSATFSLWEKAALWSVLGVAVLGLLYAGFLVGQVLREGRGTPKMIQIAEAIQNGANAYLIQQFKAIVFLILLLTAALYFTAHEHHIALGRACAFFMGACFSGLVGFIGMNLAVRGNVRVAAAARTSFGQALKIAYRTGTITGMLTDGLGLFGGTLIFMVYGERAYEVLLGFGFGGTLLALFMRVGGGIYTKAADVGADLVGKIEKGIPEDDPRNAATIADNVGDNVGDCAGMAADIFESYEVTIVSAMILGWASFGHKGVIFPLLVRAIGVVSSIIGTYAVRTSDQVRNAMRAINIGFILSAVISIVGFSVLGFYYLRFPNTGVLPMWASFGIAGLDMRPVWTTLVGILLAITVNRLTEYFTDPNKPPVQAVARSTTTGHATTIISGIAVGYESTVWAILSIALAIFCSTLIYAGTHPTFIAYGVAMCGIGMLTLTGNNISMDVFGPVADNANGIGEMAHLEPAARQTLADLDAVGNTTKAITKGIAIASAVVAAVSLFNAYITDIGTILKQTYGQIAATLSIAAPEVFIGFLIGGAIPFLFSSLTIEAVGRAAGLIVHEVRAQFKDAAIWEGKKLPDYARVVSICTTAAQKELIGPALLAIVIPIVVGFAFGTPGLGGFLGGAILSGQLLAVFMANAGGAWDNAKKFIEDGQYGGKGSEAHKASVTGDTVGDPLKDTAGPALNPMIKVMNMVALLVVPLILAHQANAVLRWLVVIGGIVIVAVAIRFPKRGFQAFVPEESQAKASLSSGKKMSPAVLAVLIAVGLPVWAEEPTETAADQPPASEAAQPVVSEAAPAASTAEPAQIPSTTQEMVLLNGVLPTDTQTEGKWLWETTEVPEGVTASHGHASAKGIQQHGLVLKPIKLSADQMFIQQVWLDPKDPPQGIQLKFKLNTGDEVGVYWEGEEEVFNPTETEEIWYYGFLPEYGKWTPLDVLVEDLGLEEEEITGLSFITFDGQALWGKTVLTQAPPLEEEGESFSAIPNPSVAPAKKSEEVSNRQ